MQIQNFSLSLNKIVKTVQIQPKKVFGQTDKHCETPVTLIHMSFAIK